MTTWKWRDLNHQLFGESLYSLIHLFIHLCVLYVPVIVFVSNLAMWQFRSHLCICSSQPFYVLKSFSDLESQFSI